MFNNNEQTPYGTKIIARTNVTNTVKGLKTAIETLSQNVQSKKIFLWIMGNEMPTGVTSILASPAGLVINTTPEGDMPPPIPAKVFAMGMMKEANNNENLNIFIKLQNDQQAKTISSARLEELDPGLYAITFEPGTYVDIEVTKNIELDGPANSEDVQVFLNRLAALSNRPQLANDILYCFIPSLDAGNNKNVYIVDVIKKKGKHLELELMKCEPADVNYFTAEPGESSIGNIAKKCNSFGKGLPLFFMYQGTPYAAEEFIAHDQMPVSMILQPWASVDESEISTLAAKFNANGLF